MPYLDVLFLRFKYLPYKSLEAVPLVLTAQGRGRVSTILGAEAREWRDIFEMLASTHHYGSVVHECEIHARLLKESVDKAQFGHVAKKCRVTLTTCPPVQLTLRKGAYIKKSDLFQTVFETLLRRERTCCRVLKFNL